MLLKNIKCESCNKSFSSAGIGTHKWRVHGKGKNWLPWPPGHGHKCWSIGLTAATDPRIKKSRETWHKNFSAGKFVSTNIGKPTPKAIRLKISKSMIKYMTEHPEMVPYRLNHSSKRSNPEIVFENALMASNINGWIAEYQHSLYTYDFAFPKIKLDIEIDGATHESEKVKKIDNRRDIFSANAGWIVIRFPAKIIKHNVVSCINATNEIIKIIS